MVASSGLSAMAMSRCCTCWPISATTLASSALRSGRLPPANTRTGPSYLRMRSTRPASWNSVPKLVLKNPSMISAAVKSFRSTRLRSAILGFSDLGFSDLGFSDEAGRDQTGAATAIAMQAAAIRSEKVKGRRIMPRRCRNQPAHARRRAAVASSAYLVLDHHRGADPHAIIEVDHVLIGHAKAAGGNRLSDRLRLVGTVDAIERRAEIKGAGAERIFDPAHHVAGQVGTTAAHLRRRGPARPFLLGADTMHAAPAEAVAADADAVADRRTVRLDEVKATFGGVHDDCARRVIGRVGDDGAGNRACPAFEVVGSHDVVGVAEEALRLRVARAGQKRQHGAKCNQPPDHFLPHENSCCSTDWPSRIASASEF